MPKKPNFIFEVRIRISEAFTLDSIVRSPRTFKPKDVQSACQNNEVVIKSGEPPASVTDLATYVMTDFFAMAHGTGLYNRQRAMWESLSKVNNIHVYQLSSGLFKKQQLEIYDFAFVDYKGKALLCANLVAQMTDKDKPANLLKAFIGRCHGKSSLTGVLACFASPFPTELIEAIQKQTHPEDPIRRYESVLPGINVPVDLLEMTRADLTAHQRDMGGRVQVHIDAPAEATAQTTANPEAAGKNEDSTGLQTVFQLVHPDLKKGKQPIALPRVRKMPRASADEPTSNDADIMPESAQQKLTDDSSIDDVTS